MTVVSTTYQTMQGCDDSVVVHIFVAKEKAQNKRELGSFYE